MTRMTRITHPRRYPTHPRIYLDMDGVIADFAGQAQARGLHPKQAKMVQGFYRDLPFMPQAQAGVRALCAMPEFLVFLATKIPDRNPLSASEKLQWVHEHLPELEERVIITPDKSCIGRPGDYLVDDRPHKADAGHFPGTFICFGEDVKDWQELVRFFDAARARLRPMQGNGRAAAAPLSG